MQNRTARTSSIESNRLAERLSQSNQSIEGAVELLERLVDEFDVMNVASARRLIAVFSRQQRTKSGYPRLRPADCARVTEALERALMANERFIRTADASVVVRLKELISTYRETDITFYPSEELRVILLEARLMLLVGNYDVAWRILGPLADRPYSIEGDFETMAHLFDLDAQTRLQMGLSEGLGRLTLSRVILLLHLRPLAAWALGSRFARFMGVSWTTRPGVGVLAHLVGVHSKAVTRMRLRRRPNLASRVLAGLGIGLNVAFSGLWLFLLRYGDLRWKSERQGQKPRDIIVTRAMGGIGDLLMMTPGLRALSKKFGRPVKLAIKKKFFPVFRNNNFVELLDIDGPAIDQLSVRRWFNLTICPAAAYETRKRPLVKKGRVELFARGMGIKRLRLSVNGWKPVYNLDDEQHEFCRQFIANHGLGGRPVIGVQPYSRDSYKDHGRIDDLIHALAAHYDVVLFHHSTDGLPSGNRIFNTATLSLEKSLALVSILDAMVSVDSAFLHAAAAFDVPVVGLFGPTDGKMFTRHHRHVRALANKRSFGCSPCWRNEDMPCALTGSVGLSPCMSSISIEQVQGALADLLAAAERRNQKLVSSASVTA